MWLPKENTAEGAATAEDDTAGVPPKVKGDACGASGLALNAGWLDAAAAGTDGLKLNAGVELCVVVVTPGAGAAPNVKVPGEVSDF